MRTFDIPEPSVDSCSCAIDEREIIACNNKLLQQGAHHNHRIQDEELGLRTHDDELLKMSFHFTPTPNKLSCLIGIINYSVKKIAYGDIITYEIKAFTGEISRTYN